MKHDLAEWLGTFPEATKVKMNRITLMQLEASGAIQFIPPISSGDTLSDKGINGKVIVIDEFLMTGEVEFCDDLDCTLTRLFITRQMVFA